jgi:serine phosphatase RsbU (regulator of sigma subunit)/CHASE1-domain containing sensor protein/anti-sigma regulatory factor (Ser/Thr protein kinase)
VSLDTTQRSVGRGADRRNGASWLLLAVVLAIGTVAAVVSWTHEQRSARTRQDAELARVVEQAEGAAQNSVAGLAGAGVLVGDGGTVDDEDLRAFGRDLRAASALEAVGYADVVTDDGRAGLEAQIGRPIIELGDAGPMVAGNRDEYWVLRAVEPLDDVTSILLGVDIAANPISAAPARAARDQGSTQLTEPVQLPAELVGDLGGGGEDVTLLFILRPLYDGAGTPDDVAARQASLQGFLISAITGDQLAEDLRAVVPEEVDLRISDGSTVIVGPREELGGPSVEQDILGRTWDIEVLDARGADHDLTTLVVSLTAALLLLVAVLGWRERRHLARMHRVDAVVGSTAELARRLSAAGTVDEISTVVAEELPTVLGAHTATLDLFDGGPVGPAPTDPAPELQAVEQLRDELCAGDVVRLAGTAQMATRLEDDTTRALQARSVRALAAMPLESVHRGVVGGLAVSWTVAHPFDELTTATLGTVVELCEQSLDRAATTDRIRVRAESLSRLAERLATADTIEGACDIVLGAAPSTVGASAVSIGLVDGRAGVLRIRHGETVADDLGQRYTTPELTEPLAFTDAARTAQPVLIPSFDEYRRRYPHTHESNALLGEGARAAFPLLVDGHSIGAIAVAWDHDQHFDDELLFSLSTIAELSAQAVHRARLMELHTLDAARSRGLAAFAQVLASCHHPREVAAACAQHLPGLTAADSIVILHRDGLGWAAEHRLRSAEVAPLLEHLLGDEDEPAGALFEVARGARRRVIATADDGGSGPLLSTAGIASAAELALSDQDGRPVGALWLGWSDRLVPTGDPEDLLSTVGDMIEQSLVRTLGADQLRSDSERNQLLADFARRLANVRSVDQLCAAVIDDGGSAVGAVVANLGLVDETRGVLDVEPNAFFNSDDHRVFEGRRLEDRLPGTDAVRDREPVLMSDTDEVEARYRGPVADTMASHGLRSSAHLPLLTADGRAIGCIGFAWPHRQEFRAVKLARLRTIAELCAQTLERARLAEAEHRLVGNIHRRVVARSASVEGTRLATRYLPASQEIGMGGDWYDSVVLDDQRIAVVVGDVAGHGIGAVADMVELRSLIRATLLQGVPLADALQRVSASWSEQTDSLATACLTVVDTANGHLEHVSAGHIPGLLRTPDGHVELLDGGRMPLLGVPGRLPDSHVVPFPPGSTLFVCTDGLIERRDRTIDDSIDAMCEVITGLDPTAGVESMADLVLDGCRPGPDHEDDIALVVLERPPAPAAVDRGVDGDDDGSVVLDHTFEATPESIPTARRLVDEHLGASGAPADMALVVSELVTNAVLHGRGDVRLRLVRRPSSVRVAVHDSSDDRPVVAEPSPDTVGGRGLRIIEAVASDWGITEDGGGKWVWAELATSEPPLRVMQDGAVTP